MLNHYDHYDSKWNYNISSEKDVPYSAAIPVMTTLVSFPDLHVFCKGERERTPLFGLAAILHRSGVCFHLFKRYASKPVLTGLGDPPVYSGLKRELHASLTQGSNKV